MCKSEELSSVQDQPLTLRVACPYQSSISGAGGGGGARNGCIGGNAATPLCGGAASPPNDAGPTPPLYCRYSSSPREAEVHGVLSAEPGWATKYDDGGGSTLHVFTFRGSGGGAVALPASPPSPKVAQPSGAEAESLLPHRTGGLGGGAAAEAGGEFHAESMSSLRRWACPSDVLRRGVPCSDNDDERDNGSAPASRNGRVARHSLWARTKFTNAAALTAAWSLKRCT